MRLEITISGQPVEIYYGLLHAEMIEGALLRGEVQSATADFFPLFFYAAHLNYCRINDLPPRLTKGAFYKWFETVEMPDIEQYIQAWEGTKGKERWDKMLHSLTALTNEQKKSIGATLSDIVLE